MFFNDSDIDKIFYSVLIKESVEVDNFIKESIIVFDKLKLENIKELDVSALMYLFVMDVIFQSYDEIYSTKLYEYCIEKLDIDIHDFPRIEFSYDNISNHLNFILRLMNSLNITNNTSDEDTELAIKEFLAKINDQNFTKELTVFNNHSIIKNPIYRKIIEDGITDISMIDGLIRIALASTNIESKKDILVENKLSKMYRALDNKYITVEASTFFELNIKPFIFDLSSRSLIINDYEKIGIITKTIEYALINKFNIQVLLRDKHINFKFGNIEIGEVKTILITDDPSSNPFSYHKNILLVEKKDTQDTEISTKLIQMVSGVSSTNTNYNRNEFKSPTINIAVNSKFIEEIFNNYAVNVYRYDSYTDEIHKKISDYVNLINDDFHKMINNVKDNLEDVKIKFRRVYDDSKTGIIDEFLNYFIQHMNLYFIKPPLSILMKGPPETGKTHFAKKIADIIYGSEKKLFTINLAEFGHGSFFNSELFGAGKGFLGSNEKTELRKFIDENINTGGVILLDESDKGKKSMLDALLTILNDGVISFKGMNACKINIKKFIFIFAGNYDNNDYTLNNRSDAFESRMKLQFITEENSTDKTFNLSSIVNDYVNRYIKLYDSNVTINIVLDESFINCEATQAVENKNRKMEQFVTSSLTNIFDSILNIWIESGEVNYKIIFKNDKLELLVL